MRKILIVLGLAIVVGSLITNPKTANMIPQSEHIISEAKTQPNVIESSVTLTKVTPTPIPTVIITPTVVEVVASNPVDIGRQMAASKYGWTGAEWDSLYQLWEHESNWNPYAWNPSGAGGIPQALPFWKMGCSLGDATCQISWGLDYIRGRYSDPITAWYDWNYVNPYKINPYTGREYGSHWY